VREIAGKRAIAELRRGQQVDLVLWGNPAYPPLETISAVYDRAVRMSTIYRLDFKETATGRTWSLFKRDRRWTWGLRMEPVAILVGDLEYL
jgi:hypothetical protein